MKVLLLQTDARIFLTSRRLVRAWASLWLTDKSSHVSIRFFTLRARGVISLTMMPSSKWVDDDAKQVRVENRSVWVASATRNEERETPDTSALRNEERKDDRPAISESLASRSDAVGRSRGSADQQTTNISHNLFQSSSLRRPIRRGGFERSFALLSPS